MRMADDVGEPRLSVQRSETKFYLRADVELVACPILASNDAWFLGGSAVIKDTNNDMSYWALSHPPGKPDFHQSKYFRHRLAVPEQL